YEQAENFFLKAIEKDEQAATAFYGMGNLYYTLEKHEQAVLMFQKALSLGLEDSDVYFMIGLSYVKQDNQILALPFLQRAIELDNKYSRMLFQYGLDLAKTCYLTEAESYFNQVLLQNFTQTNVMYSLALIKAEQENVLETL